VVETIWAAETGCVSIRVSSFAMDSEHTKENGAAPG
jgi:hypothetical protein